MVGGKLYVFGGDPVAGTVDCLTANMTLAMYDPAKAAPNRWTILASPPIDANQQCRYALAAASSIIHVVGGGECFEDFPSSSNTLTALPPRSGSIQV